MNGILAWAIFLALSLVAIVMAASMILTMSMYRAGLALMASFVALAGLFILLDADLLAAIQIMMNVGGMLIMVLFMVMIMMDPGGEMMWDMKRKMHLPGPGAFSMHMPRDKPSAEPLAQDNQTTIAQVTYTCPMHPEVRQDQPGKCPTCGMNLIEVEEGQQEQDQLQDKTIYTCLMHPEVRQDHPGDCPKCGMRLVEAGNEQPKTAPSEQVHDMGTSMSGHDMSPEHTMDMGLPHTNDEDMSMDTSEHDMNMSSMQNMSPRQNYEMMVDMAMSTAQLPWAIIIGAVSAFLLIALLIKTPWPISSAIPTLDAAREVGVLLLSRYMIAFEGAAFLIVAGIAGAVLLGKRERRRSQAEEVADEKEATATEEQETDGEKLYTCPMHADVREHHAGNCPKCGMRLVPVEETANAMHEHRQGGHA
jgi:NADH-quinone oxidoreductase subunit J